MARCYACDRMVEAEALDPKTDRAYCSECFSWTTEEMLRADARKEYPDATEAEIEVMVERLIKPSSGFYQEVSLESLEEEQEEDNND